MAKQSFNWKSMFINEDNPAPDETSAPVSTPENKFPNQPMASATGTNPYLDEIFSVYDKGLESLNHSGFDFFELYRSVMAVGPNNPQSYQMAFAMGKTLNADLSKAFLLEKAQFYISEIEKVYVKYDAAGNAKRSALSDTINKEKDSLTKEIQDLESKIAALQKELELKRMYLQKVDPGNVAQFSEIQLKIEANNLAKHKILDSINTVVKGINQYLQ